MGGDEKRTWGDVEMKSFILICSCFGMEKRAKEAFGLLTHGQEVLPPVIKGRDRIHKLGKQINSPHIIAISKLSGRFAYYVELEGGNITKEYNLITGKRIA